MGEKVLYETRKKARNSNKRYETRIKGTKFEEKARNSNKRYKTLIKGTKCLKRRFKILMKICKTTKRNNFFKFQETIRNTFFVISFLFSFAKGSKLGKTVSCFVQFRILQN